MRGLGSTNIGLRDSMEGSVKCSQALSQMMVKMKEIEERNCAIEPRKVKTSLMCIEQSYVVTHVKRKSEASHLTILSWIKSILERERCFCYSMSTQLGKLVASQA